MRRFRYAVIVLVLGAAAACTSDAKPEPSDPPSTPPTPASTSATRSATGSATPPIVRSPSPTVATTGPNVRPGETVPVLPALAKTNSRPGAAVAASFWFRALDWGYATTDSTLAKSLYLKQCSDCAKFMKTFDEAKTVGNSFRGGRLVTTSRQIISMDKRHPGATVVDLGLNQARLTTIGPGGKSLGVDPAVNALRYRVWLSWTVNRWMVLDYKQVVS